MGNIRHQTLRPDVRLLHLSLSCSLFIVSSLHYLLGLNYYYVWSFGRCRGQPCSWCTHTHLLVGFYRWQRPEPRDGWLSGCDILNLLPLSGCLFEFSSQLYQTRGGILLNCSSRSINIIGKASETWNVALITTLIHQAQSLHTCGCRMTFPLFMPMISCLIWCTRPLTKCAHCIIHDTICLGKCMIYVTA